MNLMEAGILVLLGGTIFNAFVVSFIAKRWLIPISVVPVLACIISFIILNYHHDHKYEGMDFAMSFQKRFSIAALFLQMTPAVLVACIVIAIKSWWRKVHAGTVALPRFGG